MRMTKTLKIQKSINRTTIITKTTLVAIDIDFMVIRQGKNLSGRCATKYKFGKVMG
jgi:hypothetical protein